MKKGEVREDRGGFVLDRCGDAEADSIGQIDDLFCPHSGDERTYFHAGLAFAKRQDASQLSLRSEFASAASECNSMAGNDLRHHR